MPKLSADLLSKQLKKIYNNKSKDSNKIGTGLDMIKPSDFVPAPDVIQQIMNVPGYPIKRITMIAGKPDSGKSTLGMLALIESQKKDFYAILVDTEKKFSMDRFEKMGGSPKDLIKISATTIEDGFYGIDEYLNTILSQDVEAKIFIVWDSIGGTPSRAELEADADETTQLATAAKVIKKNLRRFVQRLDNSNIGLLLINQSYCNIGSVGRSNSGGEGVDYFSSIILQLARKGNYIVTSKGQTFKAGVDTVATVTKNHLFQGERTLYKSEFRVKAYEIVSIKKREDEDSDEAKDV